MFAPESSWVPPDMSTLPTSWMSGRVAIDTETRDPTLRELGPGVRSGGYVVGISFAIEDGPSFYLPIRHEEGDNLPEEQVLRYLRDMAARYRGIIVGMNLQYDLDYLLEEGVDFSHASKFRDLQVADPLTNELHRSYSMQSIAERRGVPGKDHTLLLEAARAYSVDAKSSLWRLPARYVGPYAEQDARLPLTLLRRIEKDLDEQDLWQVYDMESDLLPCLVRMRRRGVRVSERRLEEIERWSMTEELAALQQASHLSGERLQMGDSTKPEPLARALKAIGYDVPKTTKGQDSITKELLAEIDHPVARAISRARKVNKLRTTFAASVRRHMVRGRIHCTFNQMRATDDATDAEKGAAYGRLSSEHVNMQQQPSRDEFAARWRSIYLPEDGELWASDDYSQQEPRWLVHYAEETDQPQASVAAQRYRDDPGMDNHQMMAELSGVPRKAAKELFLGKCYGMGGPKLCRKLGLPTRWAIAWHDRSRQWSHCETAEQAYEHLRASGQMGRVMEVAGAEGQAIITTFDQRLPFVSKLAKMCEGVAKARGYIRTWSGRRCRFPDDERGGWEWTHKALNRLIQGSSADQTKMAFIELDRQGFRPMLQVHDEICLSVRDPAEAEAAAEIMRNIIPLRVPMKVDVEVGPSWGEAE